MTNRNSWKLGASTCILCGCENHTEQGFEAYSRAKIEYAEFTVPIWTGAFEKLDFYNHPEKVFEAAKSCGVTISSLHAPFSCEISFSNPDENQRKTAVETINRAISSAARIGIKTIVLHPSGAHYESYPERSALLSQSMKHVGEVYAHCESLGVTLAVENLTGRGVCGIPSEMIAMLSAYPNLKVCFDTNHCTHILPEDYLDALIKAGMQGRIAAVHISDYDLCEEKHRLPGDGKINWESVLSKLEELDFDGVFMYEVSKGFDREELYTPQMVADNFREINPVGATLCGRPQDMAKPQKEKKENV